MEEEAPEQTRASSSQSCGVCLCDKPKVKQKEIPCLHDSLVYYNQADSYRRLPPKTRQLTKDCRQPDTTDSAPGFSHTTQVTGSQEAFCPLSRNESITFGLLQLLSIYPTSAPQPLRGVRVANTHGCKLSRGK